MATTRHEIAEWLEEGKKKGATHMLVVCDTFDYEDFPVYVMPGQDVKKCAKPYQDCENMTRLMEVYSYKMDIKKQLEEKRSFNWD